ncbi:MAG TPA: iron-containing redox enzyme family protein [Acidimicrobiales bacterium]|jgi:quercetin dioxygenase-like cupin family protein
MEQHHHKTVLDGEPKYDLDDYELFRDCLLQFGDSELFADTEEWLSIDNPYRRTLRPHVFKYLDFSRPLTRDEILTYTSLTANRTLLTVYETDFVLLPRGDFASKQDDFRAFYDPRRKVLAEVIRPRLERFVFDFLGSEVSVSGKWTLSSLRELFEDQVAAVRRNDPIPSLEAILKSSNREHAAKTFLIQLAGDFLMESSPMARNVLGNFGDLQSELFKIVIDEFGYGVHRTKHSTLFEHLLESVGLDPSAHAYWQFYLTSSLLMNNYFNWISKDHSLFFRYLGAVLQTETAFISSCAQMAETFRIVYGEQADVTYFLEHVSIDQDHSRMAWDKLVQPAVEQYGEAIIPEIVRGFEEARYLADLADQDFVAQVAWMDGQPEYKSLHPAVLERIESGAVTCPVQTFVEPRGELSVTHVHDGDELCHIESGVMHFITGHDRITELKAGEGVVIQHNRLHGAIIDSDECVYHIHSIGDHQRCLS